LREQCGYGATVSRNFLRGETLVTGQSGKAADHERGTRGASLTGGADAAFTPVGLRECVYGVAGRNFSERGGLRQSFAGWFKALRSEVSFEVV
jgi:hypothetical protein